MAYEITFKDRSTIFVSNDRGEKVKALWFNGDKNTPIDIDGNGYQVGSITKIVRAPEPTIVDPWANADRMLKDPGCRGEQSIAKELMRIVSKSKDWKKLQDPKWRVEQTKKLKATGKVFCDTKAGTCGCAIQVAKS